MKKLIKTSITMFVLLLLNSCANTYIHNTVATPTFTDSTPVQVNVGIGLRQAELNLAVLSKNKKIYGIANGYVGLKNFKPGQFFGDLGIGIQKQVWHKYHISAYYTLGQGSSYYELEVDNGFLWQYHYKVSSDYVRNALTAFVKKSNGQIRPFFATRLSYLYYSKIQFTDIDDGSGGSMWNASPYTETVTKHTNVNEYLIEPSFGMDIRLTNRLFLTLQNTVSWPIKGTNSENYYGTYALYVVRIGLSIDINSHRK